MYYVTFQNAKDQIVGLSGWMDVVSSKYKKYYLIQVVLVLDCLISGTLGFRPSEVLTNMNTNWDFTQRWGPYLQSLGGQGSISCGQYLDRTLGKFPPIYGPHLKMQCA